MIYQPFPMLGQQLRKWRKARSLTQPALARRLGRDPARISELERDLLGSRWGRDRLTLLAEACDALSVVPVLVPRDQVDKVLEMVAGTAGTGHRARPVTTAFDDLFIDLGSEHGNESDGEPGDEPAKDGTD
jgi:transcriptional regulator with XRE-family HTH domain